MDSQYIHAIIESSMLGFLDSGVGGLSLLHAFIQAGLCKDYIYFADTKHFPYGTRDNHDLISITYRNILFLREQEIRTVIFACNTLCSRVLSDLQKQFPDMIFINIIDLAVLAAVRCAESDTIGICATQSTVESGAFSSALANNGFKAQEINGSQLIQCIEYGAKIEKLQQEVHILLKQLDESIDTLILGCTHFMMIDALIETHIKIYFPHIKHIIRADHILASHLKVHGASTPQKMIRGHFYASGDVDSFKKKVIRFMQEGVLSPQLLNFVFAQPQSYVSSKIRPEYR